MICIIHQVIKSPWIRCGKGDWFCSRAEFSQPDLAVPGSSRWRAGPAAPGPLCLALRSHCKTALALSMLHVSYTARTCVQKMDPVIIISAIFSSHRWFAQFVTFKPLWMVVTCRNQVIITKPGHKYIYVGVGEKRWRGWMHFFLASWKLKGP